MCSSIDNHTLWLGLMIMSVVLRRMFLLIHATVTSTSVEFDFIEASACAPQKTVNVII